MVAGKATTPPDEKKVTEAVANFYILLMGLVRDVPGK